MVNTYIQPGSLTQKYEAFRPLYFTWQDSSAGAMIGMIYKQITWVLVGSIESIKTERYNYHDYNSRKFGESYKIHQTKTIQIDYTFWLTQSTYYHKLEVKQRYSL